MSNIVDIIQDFEDDDDPNSDGDDDDVSNDMDSWGTRVRPSDHPTWEHPSSTTQTRVL